MGVLFIHMKGGAGMRITDYGAVSCWYERNLLAKIDREIKHKQQATKQSQTATHNKVKSGRKDAGSNANRPSIQWQ